jgi:hypothetical protein
MSLEDRLNQALTVVTKNDVANAIFNITDVKGAMKAKELNRTIDEDSDTTIEELLDDVLMFLNTLECSVQDQE